jgi:hypothetical protein
MKLLSLFSTISLIALLSTCNKCIDLSGNTTFNLKDTFDLPVCKSAINSENHLSIAIDSVLNDSRCPINADCIWKGNAAVRFIFSNKQVKTKFVLNTNSGVNFPSDTIIDGYSIKLIQLTPYPETSRIISQSEYTAVLAVR